MKSKLADLQNHINSLPYSEFKDMVIRYGYNHQINVQDDIDVLNSLDLQKRLEKLKINTKCPKCGSEHVVKNGNRNHIQRFKCKKCENQFTLFTNTIMEKTKWHWSVWVKVMEMTLNNYSLAGMKSVLEKDYGYVGINHKTLFLWRHKIIHAMASMPQPVLSGIVQVDETFIREAQKGSRKLESYIGKDEQREPRYGYNPSKYGVMGAEFATVTTAVDNTGHCVCKVTGLGRLTTDVSTDMFENHLNAPAYICSDGNSVYRDYCKVQNIPHYERPSNFMKILAEHGYVSQSRSDEAIAIKQHQSNEAIQLKLYDKGLIDRLTFNGFLPYAEFKEIKKKNKLNLSRVNRLHGEIKGFIYGNMTNVSTKYLEDYIGYFTFIKNWSVDNGRYPHSKRDAEKILVEILKYQGRYTVTELKAKVLTLPKPSSRYMTLLKTYTKKAQELTKNKYFKFDEEDRVISFDKRTYLLDIPETRIKEACKEFGVKHKRKWVRWAVVSEMLKHPKATEIIIYLINQDKVMKIYKEDIDYLNQQHYKDSLTG